MTSPPDITHVLMDHLGNPSSSFSIGSYGAIAEFHQGRDETRLIDEPARLTVATARGAIHIDPVDGIKPLAYEILSRRWGRWMHGILFCLPEAVAASNRRTTLFEVGPDTGAVQARHRDSILFDMGLAAPNIDFCIRTDDASLIALLRAHAGQPLLQPGSAAMKAIIEASPHRVALSRLGRVEVYQRIPLDRSPEGPHTHVLPKFLRTGRTHSANIPVPEGYLPGLSLYPANPLVTSGGEPKPFDRGEHAAFQDLFAAWGAPLFVREKQRAIRAVQDDQAPDGYAPHDSRLGRTAFRIALRQARLTVGDGEARVARWQDRFDRSDPA